MVKFTWKIRNRLNRRKNQISDFYDCYFSSYCHFCSKNCKFSMNFHDKSKNKNRKINFLFDSAHCAFFIKTGAKLRREVCISLVGNITHFLADETQCKYYELQFLIKLNFMCSYFMQLIFNTLYSNSVVCN